MYLGAAAGTSEDVSSAGTADNPPLHPVGLEDMPTVQRGRFVRVTGRKSAISVREMAESVLAAAGPDAAAQLTLGMRKKALLRTTLGPMSYILRHFAPAAVVPQTDLPYLRGDWIAELRTVTVVFASLGIPPEVLAQVPTRESHM